jgi:uncharacterized protein (TIGR03083 family)
LLKASRGRDMSVTKASVEDDFPEWGPFAAAVQERKPEAGTWCEAWTVRDVVVHQAGNAQELARALRGQLEGKRADTRPFEAREAPYRAMTDAELWSALVQRLEELSEVTRAASEALGPETDVPWTGRTMKVSWFAEHMREELVLHRWDLTADDATARAALGEPWMTEHSVIAVGRPLLARGSAALGARTDRRVEGRLRAEGTDDVVVGWTPDGASISLARPEGDAAIESDAATRCLFLWGRRPFDAARWSSRAGPETLGALRLLLSGY